MSKLTQFPARKQSVSSAQETKPKSLNELIVERDGVIEEIKRRDRLPMNAQAQLGNALESKLAILDQQIAETEAEQVAQRLAELDRDLTSGNREYEYLTAVRGGIRIKIQIMPSKAFGFVAIAYFNRRQMYAGGQKPSNAFRRLLDNIKYQLRSNAIA